MIKIQRSVCYGKNYDGARGPKGAQQPCCLCGIGIHAPGAYLHLHDGGGFAVTESEAMILSAAGDLGLHPIGPECIRRRPELAPYVVRTPERAR
ncbi:hypothetical protein EPN52_00905 [bacterium]|nr:MAG: hypothetical protein EPN52_00905 [bacterium]